jgi:hypothetical protein
MTALRGSCLYAGVRFEIDGVDAMLASPLRARAIAAGFGLLGSEVLVP